MALRETTAAKPRRLGSEDVVVLSCLAVASLLAWLWLLTPAGDGMAMEGSTSPWSAAYLAPAFVMWALMMVAMMLPSATPMILLHARVARQGADGRWPPATLAFVLAYLALWSAFAALAALAQAALVASGALSAMSLSLGDARLAGLLLLLAAAYNLSAAKRVCLDNCRSPLDFVVRRWRPGIVGALRMGLAHGLFCLGCCWALMLLLFVGGVMNLAWVAGLSLVVLVEKYGPARTPWLVAGLLAIGAAVLLASA
jgi:predicted metal-binding membrane protein